MDTSRTNAGAKDANWEDRGGQTSWRQVSKPTNLVLKEPMARVAQLPSLTGLRDVAAYSVLFARTLNVPGVLSPSLLSGFVNRWSGVQISHPAPASPFDFFRKFTDVLIFASSKTRLGVTAGSQELQQRTETGATRGGCIVQKRS